MNKKAVVLPTKPCEKCIMFGAKQLLMEEGMRCNECLRSPTFYGYHFRLYELYVPKQEAPQCPMCGAMCEWHNVTRPVPGWYCPNHHFIITLSKWAVLRKELSNAHSLRSMQTWNQLKAYAEKKEEEIRQEMTA